MCACMCNFEKKKNYALRSLLRLFCGQLDGQLVREEERSDVSNVGESTFNYYIIIMNIWSKCLAKIFGGSTTCPGTGICPDKMLRNVI